ncbi:MAG: ThiF family adenylyltransferase [Bdellovibrionota bacterium]
MNQTPSIVVVGAGGLGCPAVWGLVESSVGDQSITIRVLDPDSIELSNLNRQVFFSAADIGSSKAEVLCREAAKLVGDRTVTLSARRIALTPETISSLLEGASCVIDATDSVPTKFLINDYCVSNRIPFCYAGALATTGQLLAYNPRATRPGCLRCMFGELSEAEASARAASCREGGIFGPVVGLIGALQAEAALDLLRGEPGSGSPFFRFELLKLGQVWSEIQAADDCPLGCGFHPRHVLDLRQKRCPATFLYTKLALEQLAGSDALDVRYGSMESVTNVIASAAEEGFRAVTEPREIAQSEFRVVFQRSSGS